MYALLLICAMAIVQGSEKNAFELADGPHVRHFPIAAGKTPEVRLKVPESENFQRGITALGGKTVLTISAKDAKTLDETEIILRRNQLLDLDSVVKVFKYEKAKPSDIAKALDELKAKDASYNLTLRHGNLLLVHGTPEIVNAAESILKSLDQLQEKADAEVISLELPAALSTEEDLMALITGLGITSGTEITYPTKDKRVVTSARTNIERIEKALAERGLLPPTTQVKAFSLKYATARDLADTIEKLGFNNVKAVPDIQANSIAITGSSKDLAAIETLVSNLDQLGGGVKWPAGYARLNIPRSYDAEMRQALKDLGNPGVVVKSYPEDQPFAVDGPFARVDQLKQLLTKRGVLGLTSEQTEGVANEQASKSTQEDSPAADANFKIFQLKYASANEVAEVLKHLEFSKVKIAPEASSNSIVVRGQQSDINIIEALLANLDIKGAGERKKIPAPDAQESQSRTYVYRLVNKPASEVAAAMNRMEIDGVNLTADERTNSVIIQAAKKELKIVIGIIQSLDMKVLPTTETTQAAPDPATGTLWTDFTKAEAMSIEAAGMLRTITKKFGNDHPLVKELKEKVEFSVTLAFELRHKLQQAEAAELRRQLTEIEARLTKREKNKAAIIEARVNSLINMDDLGWEAMTKPKGQAPTSQVVNPNPRSRNNEAAAPAITGKSKELAEAWERVDRDEYIPVKIPINFGGMGMGGLGGMGGMGFPGAIPAVSPAPVIPQYQQGVLIRGNAMIRDSFGLQSDQVVWIGDKQLPCRLAAVAPFSIHAYRSARFPSMGITDFTHESKEGEQVWAFIPNQQDTLVKAKVFRKSGPEFAIDEETSFGIEAEGKIETGYLVCNDQGEFLGIVSYHNGSLGACWSAKAIGDWLQRTNLEAPDPVDPLKGRVIVALPGSAYLPIATEAKGGIGGGFESSRPGRAFYGAIIKGVIVTHPEVCKSEWQTSSKILYGGKTLTFEKMKLSEDGRFSLIRCKELTAKDGFTSAHEMVHGKEFAIPLGTRARDVQIYGEKMGSVEVVQPTEDEIDSFETARQSRSVVRHADAKGFDIEWLGNFNSVGLPVVTTGGHFLGVVDSDNPGSLKTSQEFQAARQHHTVHARSAKEILRLVDEESKKLSEGSAATTASKSSPAASTELPGEGAAAKPKSANGFWLSIKEPKAVIPVFVNHRKGNDSPSARSNGAIINGCIFLPRYLMDDEFVEVGEKSLPQREAGITPGGLYLYHRDRLPTGYTLAGKTPKEGDTVWTVTAGERDSLLSGKVYVADETNKDLPAQTDREFSFESDGQIAPGAVVFSNDGEFVGIISRNKGSLAVCENAQSIMEYMKRIKVAAPNPTDPSKSQIWFNDAEIKRGWNALVVRGVVVAPPDLLDQDLTKLKIGWNGKFLPLSKRHSCRVLGDRLAFMWTNELKPTDGIIDFREDLDAADFVTSLNGDNFDNDFLTSQGLKRTGTIYNGPFAVSQRGRIASSIAESRDTEFDLNWRLPWASVGEGIFDPGLHLVGFNLTKLEEDSQTKLQSRKVTIVRAKEVFRLIEEESKKLPPPTTPEKPAEKPPEPDKAEPETNQPDKTPPETPKTSPPRPKPQNKPEASAVTNHPLRALTQRDFLQSPQNPCKSASIRGSNLLFVSFVPFCSKCFGSG